MSLKLLGLPIGDRSIDTETSVTLKHFKEMMMVRDSKRENENKGPTASDSEQVEGDDDGQTAAVTAS